MGSFSSRGMSDATDTADQPGPAPAPAQAAGATAPLQIERPFAPAGQTHIYGILAPLPEHLPIAPAHYAQLHAPKLCAVPCWGHARAVGLDESGQYVVAFDWPAACAHVERLAPGSFLVFHSAANHIVRLDGDESAARMRADGSRGFMAPDTRVHHADGHAIALGELPPSVQREVNFCVERALTGRRWV